MRLIDADALDYLCFKIIEDDYNQGAAPTSWAQAYSAFQDDIDNAPTIEAEPVRYGRWLAIKEKAPWLVCSECGTYLYNEQKSVTKYCYNCGAKMEEEQV